MTRLARLVRGARVSVGQLILVSAVSAVVSALIVISALGETPAERAVIAALRSPRVIRASAPVIAAVRETPVTTAEVAAAPVRSAAAAGASGSATGSTGSGGGGSQRGGSGRGSVSGSGSGGGSGAGSGSGSGGGSGSGDAATPPPSARVKHLFVISLSTTSYHAAFGRGSAARYLDRRLVPKGELLTGYRTLTGAPLPDYIAMVSGQAPNRDTRRDCPVYAEFRPGATAADGLLRGRGCVYPNTVLTLGDQLDAANRPWRAYIGGMGAACRHPDSGALDATVTPGGAGATGTTTTTTAGGTTTAAGTTTVTGTTTTTGTGTTTTTGTATSGTTTTTTTTTTAGTTTTTTTPSAPTPSAAGPTSTGGAVTPYATDRNPFVYFHSLLDLGDCQSDDLPAAKLTSALSRRHVPSLVFISPAPCDAGAAATCPGGRPGGIVAADGFLRRTVPVILRTAAYRSSGALLIVFTAPPPVAGKAPGGPVRTGALILSPFTRRGSRDRRALGPYSVLRSVENVFGLTALGHARTVPGFDSAAFAGRRATS